MEKTVQAPVSASGTLVVDAISPERLAEIFRNAGYRVTLAEQNGRLQLMSASQGIGFVVRFGNPGGESGAHIDYTLSCALQVQGELPVDMVPSWNRTKRFARLAAHQQFLLLEMDVMVSGGVTERHLRSTIELWDRLLQEFLLHIRRRPTMAHEQATLDANASTVGQPATHAGSQRVETDGQGEADATHADQADDAEAGAQ
nr:YbjN domain-containing protein [Pararobbsia silviterrae]